MPWHSGPPVATGNGSPSLSLSSSSSQPAIADNEQHGHTAQHGQAQGGHALQGGVVESRGCSVLSNMNESSRFPQLGALHLHPRSPSRLKVHTAHFAVRKHFVPLHRGEVVAAVAHAASHITCTTAQRSSSVSSAPHPPTVWPEEEVAASCGFRSVNPAPLPPETVLEVPEANPTAAFGCHSTGPDERSWHVITAVLC